MLHPYYSIQHLTSTYSLQDRADHGNQPTVKRGLFGFLLEFPSNSRTERGHRPWQQETNNELPTLLSTYQQSSCRQACPPYCVV
eukprot:scaffold39084_cov200-Skeletonema_marinoi.AAC.12